MRGDLDLPPGRTASKAGQAFINAYAKSPTDIAAAYLSDGEGTQVVLVAPDEVALRRAHVQATELGLTCAPVVSEGVLLAIGIGPVTRDMARSATKGLPCMK